MSTGDHKSFLKDTFLRRWNALDASWRFAITAFLIVRLFYGLWSWIILTIQPLAIQNTDLMGEPVLTVFNLSTSQAYIYRREVDGQVLVFRTMNAATIIDTQTGSIWSASTGTALSGQYQGITLSPSKASPDGIFPYFHAQPYLWPWLAIWQRFDANWYISLAENGYGSIPGDDHYPPLFPVLLRLLKPVFGSTFLAGLALSHLATLYVVKLLYVTFSHWGEDAHAKRSTLFFLIYPASFFLFSVYSESLFLVTALLAFQQMRKRSWGWAGFWSFCAILTRLQGAALVVALVYLMWQDRPFLRKFAHWFGLGLPALGGLFYLFLRSRQVTDGTIPFVESEWHARLVPPWETYGYAVRTLLSGNFTFIDALNWSVATLFIFLLIAGWRKIPLEYNLYSVFSLLIILIRIVETQPLISMSRYALMLFPAFFVLGITGKNPWVRRLILYTFILLNLYLSAQFFLWGWVA